MELSYSYRPKNSVKFSKVDTNSLKTRRKRVSGIDDIEMAPTRQRSAGILKKAKKKNIQLKKRIPTDSNLTFKQKFFWVFVSLTILRLFFMERGVIDFYQKKLEISDIRQEIIRLTQDNIALQNEIKKIKYDSSYQKKMARQHLGVIARDEYLILFAEESAEKSI